jgi:hypothetical protein
MFVRAEEKVMVVKRVPARQMLMPEGDAFQPRGRETCEAQQQPGSTKGVEEA